MGLTPRDIEETSGAKPGIIFDIGAILIGIPLLACFGLIGL